MAGKAERAVLAYARTLDKTYGSAMKKQTEELEKMGRRIQAQEDKIASLSSKLVEEERTDREEEKKAQNEKIASLLSKFGLLEADVQALKAKEKKE